MTSWARIRFLNSVTYFLTRDSLFLTLFLKTVTSMGTHTILLLPDARRIRARTRRFASVLRTVMRKFTLGNTSLDHLCSPLALGTGPAFIFRLADTRKTTFADRIYGYIIGRIARFGFKSNRLVGVVGNTGKF